LIRRKLLVNEQYERAKRILSEYAASHKELADMLVDREVIFAEDLERVFGKRPWTSRTQEILDEQKRLEEAKELAAMNAALQENTGDIPTTEEDGKALAGTTETSAEEIASAQQEETTEKDRTDE
jgi:cell division protease FtsH